jgi:TPR repeat protein
MLVIRQLYAIANILAVAAAFALGITQAHAGDLEDGLTAFAHGDYAIALKLLRPFAELKNASAQNTLGLIYAGGGTGVAQDFGEALKWYQRAANQGHGRSRANLGVMYYNGDGVPKDYVEAYMWFDLALAAGFEDAVKYRSLVEEIMTPEQIAQARKRAKGWKAGAPQ